MRSVLLACAAWQLTAVCAAFVAFSGASQRQARQQQRAGRFILASSATEYPKRKVVVTGLGTFTSLGHDAETFFNNLLDGKCGIARLERFDPELSAIKISSEVKNFQVGDYWAPKDAKRYDRYAHLAMAAAKTALSDGGLAKEDIVSERFGVLIGSGVGGLESVETSCRCATGSLSPLDLLPPPHLLSAPPLFSLMEPSQASFSLAPPPPDCCCCQCQIKLSCPTCPHRVP
jgi:hypothetical protein